VEEFSDGKANQQVAGHKSVTGLRRRAVENARPRPRFLIPAEFDVLPANAADREIATESLQPGGGPSEVIRKYGQVWSRLWPRTGCRIGTTSRDRLIRICVVKFEAGALDEDLQVTELFPEYEARARPPNRCWTDRHSKSSC